MLALAEHSSLFCQSKNYVSEKFYDTEYRTLFSFPTSSSQKRSSQSTYFAMQAGSNSIYFFKFENNKIKSLPARIVK